MSFHSPTPSSPLITTVDHDGDIATSISTVHQDIIQTHILTRLDGPTLAAASCASSQLHALSTQGQLWRQICTATWPSINDEKVRHVISSFPAGHRSFFSDSFPVLDHHQPSNLILHQHPTAILPTELISCVDVYYKNTLIITKTHAIDTVTDWFHCSPFRVELFGSKESVSTPILYGGEGDTWLEDLGDNLTLSWILIDPLKKRAGNLSSGRAVTVERQWLTGDVQARFATIMAGDGRLGSEMEDVKCEVVVTCGGKEGGGLHVREVSMQVEDMEGRSLVGRDSLVILQEAMEKGKRRKRGKRQGQDGKERYEEFVERKRVRKEKKDKKERALDMACICLGVTIFFTLWSFILFR